MPTMTAVSSDAHAFRKHYLTFGPTACVSKLGRQWVIWGGRMHPSCFATKGEAVAKAREIALALGRIVAANEHAAEAADAD